MTGCRFETAESAESRSANEADALERDVSSPGAAALAAALQTLDPEVVDARPRSGLHGVPDTLAGVPCTFGPFTRCAACGTGTWARYDAPSCRACAWGRWRTEQRTRWQVALVTPWVPMFALLFDQCEGLVELRAFAGQARPPVGRLFCAPTDNTALAAFLARHRTHDVYFGVATRRDASSGTLTNCQALGALFIDLDFKVTPEAEARARLARCPLPPSALVHSGGGLHGYWRLREPLALPAEAESAKRQLRRLAYALGGDLSAAEPARVLRVPGTLNVKPEYGTPRPVHLEESP